MFDTQEVVYLIDGVEGVNDSQKGIDLRNENCNICCHYSPFGLSKHNDSNPSPVCTYNNFPMGGQPLNCSQISHAAKKVSLSRCLLRNCNLYNPCYLQS